MPKVDRISSVAAACAVIVSVFSAVISCSSQRDVEQIKQSYSYCNAKVAAINEIIQTHFRSMDDAVGQISILTFNPSGLRTIVTDPEKIRSIFVYAQGIATTIDRIWREASPYMTGDRRVRLQAAYDKKLKAFEATAKATNEGRLDPALGLQATAAMDSFSTESQKVLSEEIEYTLKNASCGVNQDS